MKDKNQNRNRKGFSLLEVVISIGIIVTVITSATGILVTVIRANSDNLNTLVAYGLAQEGIEGIRMIRDSNFLLGVKFNGTVGKNGNHNIWGTSLFNSNSKMEKDLVLVKNLSYSSTTTAECTVQNFRPTCLPFSLKNADPNHNTNNTGNEQIFKTNKGYFVQGTNVDSITDSVTPFSRVIQIIPKINDTSGTDKKIHALIVNSKVTWKGNNQQLRTVELSTILTDWKFKQ